MKSNSLENSKNGRSVPVGVSTTSTYPLSLPDTFSIASDIGYDGIEVMVSYDKDTRNPSVMRRLADKHDLPILSIHAPTLLLTQFTGGRDPLTKLRNSAALAKAVDAPTVVVHPPFRWQAEYANQFCEIVAQTEDQFGVRVAVENMFPWRVKGRNMRAYAHSWEYYAERVNSLTIDFSHAALSGKDGFKMIKTHYDRLAHIHLCDGHGTQKLNGKNQLMDQHVLPGEGGQRIRESLSFLGSNNWSGSIVAEINTRSTKDKSTKEHMLSYTLNYARAALAL